ncbi:hypothetical protein Ancab_026756 [Ancistrocladus abbreviatus]
MSEPLYLDIISDDENDNSNNNGGPFTPTTNRMKRPKTDAHRNPTFLIIDDDPTPQKSRDSISSTPLIVPETPMSDFLKSVGAIVKCTAGSSNPDSRSSNSDRKFSGKLSIIIRRSIWIIMEHAYVSVVTDDSGLICLESDNECEDCLGKGNSWENKTTACFNGEKYLQLSSTFIQSAYLRQLVDILNNFSKLFCLMNWDVSSMLMYEDSDSHPISSEDNTLQMPSFDDVWEKSLWKLSRQCGSSCIWKKKLNNGAVAIVGKDPYHDENNTLELVTGCKGKSRVKGNAQKKKGETNEIAGKKKMTKEERMRLMEEKKLKKEQEKLQKAALKAEAAELKKLEKEMQRWEKGKFALKSIVAEIDTKVVELRSVGGHLLTRLAEKDLRYQITSNPIEGSIVWTMTVPEQISQFSPKGTEIPYVLLVYEAEEFCKLAGTRKVQEPN